ncbi:MAG TPA: sugar ABC transporter ATP-binding protein [Pirellulaceae bacterium]|nr:sugar ABC transporter ATP-binding protein [Pirellulaceae bacterium]
MSSGRADEAGDWLLEAVGIGKRFPGVVALSDVTLRVRAGEVLALVGENGAGKSTLMKILAGVQSPDTGTLRMNGRDVAFPNVAAALSHGVALIHQELNLADNLDLAANIFLGREPNRLGIIDRRATARQAKRWLGEVGLDLDPATPLSRLSIGQQQLVEIAKALSVDARVLIMDEPTSSLSARETQTLFDVVRGLRARGISVIYISHRLAEIEELADHVTVFRDGRNAGELRRDEITHEAMVRAMVGRDLSQFYARNERRAGETVLETIGLRSPTWPQHPIDLTVRAGEIVGMAGLVGAGRTELLRTIFGIDRAAGGTIRIAGVPATIRDPRDAIRHGVALVPEDRKRHGVVVDMTVERNAGLAGLWRHRRFGALVDRRRERSAATEAIANLAIRTPGPQQIVRYLSGGNQQKVVIGKWLSVAPRILLMDEPTRGIDIGAKHEIYQLMERLSAEGTAILFASSEMEEVIGMSDRVLVMHEGRLTGELDWRSASEQAILRLATGQVA